MALRCYYSYFVLFLKGNLCVVQLYVKNLKKDTVRLAFKEKHISVKFSTWLVFSFFIDLVILSLSLVRFCVSLKKGIKQCCDIIERNFGIIQSHWCHMRISLNFLFLVLICVNFFAVILRFYLSTKDPLRTLCFTGDLKLRKYFLNILHTFAILSNFAFVMYWVTLNGFLIFLEKRSYRHNQSTRFPMEK